MDSKTRIRQDNSVLQAGHKNSGNFWKSDLLLRNWLNANLKGPGMAYLAPLAEDLGKKAATIMDDLSRKADKNGPVLNKRNRFGENIDEIEFHPAYWQLMEIAIQSEMMRLKWEPSLRKQFTGQRHKMGFALGYLFAMSESGQYCPLCMTDGVAHLIDKFASEEDRDRLLPHIYTQNPAEFHTGAMFLTEKAGGSDVGANLCEASHLEDDLFALKGEKWFCSNVNADLIFALARTDDQIPGTKGLSIFLVERKLADGSPNPLEIVRLKDKLGTRSMASGECLLDGTVGKLVGEEQQGFHVMAEMINLSRLYNSVAALAGGRRALAEAWEFLNYRVTFGKPVLSHALVRDKIWELASLNYFNFLLVFRTVAAMDAAEAGNEREAELLRMLTPITKRDSAEMAVYLCRESMELMGGMGYIEEGVIPKMMRDVMVLPIWEGAGNIMLLDMLRASSKSNGLAFIFEEIERSIYRKSKFQDDLAAWLKQVRLQFKNLQGLSQRDEIEFAAKPAFLNLTKLYKCCLAHQEWCDTKSGAAQLAIEWMLATRWPILERKLPPTEKELAILMAWEF
jgi:alkylation response protein AidB-like acyl-CoA dehydrogenase